MVNAMPQLALDFRWDTAADLARFVARGNEQAVAAVAKLAKPQAQSLYLAGPAGSGKSHLLQAACGLMSEAGKTAVYIPLAEHINRPATSLEGLEALSLVAIDDIDRAAGEAEWEEALFHCYNRIRDAGGHLLIAARPGPKALGLQLADLTSRLQALLRWRLTPPDDARRREILLTLVANRGLSLPRASLVYLLRHQARDVGYLVDLVERLDVASLQTGRRLTVPFIKSVLED